MIFLYFPHNILSVRSAEAFKFVYLFLVYIQMGGEEPMVQTIKQVVNGLRVEFIVETLITPPCYYILARVRGLF